VTARVVTVLREAHPLKSRTDQQRHFPDSPAPGKYTAVTRIARFRNAFRAFAISPDAVQEDLNVQLNMRAIA
jgi:hypothetical protein